MMDLEEKIREHLIAGRLPCPSAFMIAGQTGITPAEVRREADRLGIRISRCQLGLFGFEEFGTRGLVHPLERIPPRIEEKLKAGLVDGSLPCITAWRIASEERIAKFLVGCAAQTASIRIGPCQLGCF